LAARCALAVISSFEGEGKLMSEEFLNLAPRRHLAYRAIAWPKPRRHRWRGEGGPVS